jgi:nitroimidazol reductase NimA-like FMN-containing flavoprotein (pyridoxamine 5'-phosphate oxidase superfamily)
MTDDNAAIARAIIDANRYMVLGTADETGLPWVTPVWFAPNGYREFLWVSDPQRRHSWNLAIRPQVSIVIFDSTVPISTGQAVYMSAVAEQLGPTDVVDGIRAFSERSEAHGARPWTLDNVMAPARHRLYRAVASEHFVLGEQDERLPVTLSSLP